MTTTLSPRRKPASTNASADSVSVSRRRSSPLVSRWNCAKWRPEGASANSELPAGAGNRYCGDSYNYRRGRSLTAGVDGGLDVVDHTHLPAPLGWTAAVFPYYV